MSELVRLTLANIWRWRLRAAFTVATLVVAFTVLGVMLPIERVFNLGVKVAHADRLIVANKASLMQTLPQRYQDRIAEVKGVARVVRYAFFGAFYQEPSKAVLALATDPQDFVDLMPEMQFASKDDLQRWYDDPASVAVGRALADKHGWKVGDMVPLYSVLYPRRDGGNSWSFRIAAIFDGRDSNSNTQSLMLHYRYFDELRAHGQGAVGWFNVRVADARQSEQVAQAIDKLFANSATETHTATEEAFTQEFMRQVGNFSLMVILALGAVFFTLVLVVANSLSESVNARMPEFALLKTLGFRSHTLAAMVLAESLLVCLIGGVAGAVLGAAAIPLLRTHSEMLASISFWWQDVAWALALLGAVALVTASIPAWRVWRAPLAASLWRTA
jgi:putative ABC transport system permease protein